MMLLQTVLQDLRYGARMLLRNAGFTTVAVLALAMGIGINTAAFTAYKAMIARSLDARDPGSMVNMALILQSGDPHPWLSYPEFEAYRDQMRSLSGVIAQYTLDELTLSGAGEIVSQRSAANGSLMARWGLLPTGTAASNAEFAATEAVSEDYFEVLGIAALHGRTFKGMSKSDLATSPSVMISENYWQRRFGGDPALVGKSIRLNGAAFTVIGITPHDFVGTSVATPDFWLPLSLEPLVHPDGHLLQDRENQCCRVFGRLAPGVSISQAQAEMNLLADHLRAQHDPHSELAKPVTAQVWPGSPFPRKLEAGLRLAIVLIMLAVGMVLVIACANVASLQLARAASRQNELGMRLSLGASRLRLIRQLLTESALLGLLAGALALLLSWALLALAAAKFAGDLPAEYGTLVFHVNPDLGVFAYAFGLSLVAGVLFGLAPALESSRSAIASALKANAGTAPARGKRLRDLLVAAQVAVSLVLLIAGSLLIRSSIHALKMDTGYESKHVVNLDFRFPEGHEYTTERKAAIAGELRTRVAALPGVADLTSARAPDDGLGLEWAAVSINSEKPADHNTKAFISYTFVQANYFQLLGIPLLFGHGFDAHMGPSDGSVIVSETAARWLWPGQNPIGRTLRMGTEGNARTRDELVPDGPAYEVIGVVRDTRGVLLDNSDAAKIYVPMPEGQVGNFPILIRTQADPAQMMPAIGAVVASVDSNLVATTSTLEQMLRFTTPFLTAAFSAAIATSIGLVGLLLASMGIYGTVSYMVVLRTREVGIRMALGARRSDVLLLMLRESARPVLAGLLAGMCMAVGASHLLRRVLFGLSTIDGVSFAGVALLFLAIALLASWLPSRRAMRVDPMVALRYE
ncbi:MAG: ABC transporter permease [Terracidiphilus sp.]